MKVAEADVKAAEARLKEAKEILGKFESEVQRWNSEVRRLKNEVERGVVDPQILLESTNQWKASIAARDAQLATIQKADAELLSAREALDAGGGRLLLVFDDGPVERILDLTGLTDRFETFRTLEAATQAVG